MGVENISLFKLELDLLSKRQDNKYSALNLSQMHD